MSYTELLEYNFSPQLIQLDKKKTIKMLKASSNKINLEAESKSEKKCNKKK